jgi:hypothetical protein
MANGGALLILLWSVLLFVSITDAAFAIAPI